jgi:hypothetical protein
MKTSFGKRIYSQSYHAALFNHASAKRFVSPKELIIYSQNQVTNTSNYNFIQRLESRNISRSLRTQCVKMTRVLLRINFFPIKNFTIHLRSLVIQKFGKCIEGICSALSVPFTMSSIPAAGKINEAMIQNRILILVLCKVIPRICNQLKSNCPLLCQARRESLSTA